MKTDKQIFIDAIPQILKTDFSNSKSISEHPELLLSFLSYVKQSDITESINRTFQHFQKGCKSKEDKIIIWWIYNYILNCFVWQNERHSFEIVNSQYDFLRKHKSKRRKHNGKRYQNSRT